MFFDIPVPVNLEPEFQFLVPGSGLTGTGNGISPDSGRNLPELIFPKNYFIKKVFIKVRHAF